jgi:hypothetical protein
VGLFFSCWRRGLRVRAFLLPLFQQSRLRPRLIPHLVDSALLALLALYLGANSGVTTEAMMSNSPQDNEFVRIVYFDIADKQVKEAAPQASLTEANALVEALFQAKAAIFAQLLREDGFVLDNCAPPPPAA